MFRKLCLISILIFCLTGLTYATSSYSPRVGEKLEYKVYYGSLYAGTQTIKVVSKSTIHNRDVVIVQSTATPGGLGSLKKYSEKVEATLDCEGLYLWALKRQVVDGNNTSSEEVDFDYSQKKAIRIFTKNNETPERREIKLPGHVVDGLALQFYLRKDDLSKSNHMIYFYSNSSGSIDETDYTVKEVNQPIKLDCGNFKSYYQIDHAKSGASILISNTDARLPLSIKTKRFENKLAKYQ